MPSAKLEEHSKELAAYKETRIFRRISERIRRWTKRIKDRTIGLDLEGVLVSKNPQFADSVSYELYDEFAKHEDRRDWVINRPHAPELVTSLQQYNRVVVCTALSRDHAEDLLRRAELPTTDLVAREDLTQKFLNHELIDEYERIFGPGIVRNELGVKVKIPSLHDLDVLVDDSTRHRDTCTKLGYPDDAERVIVVPPFAYTTLEELSACARDTGILGIAEMLRDFFAKGRPVR